MPFVRLEFRGENDNINSIMRHFLKELRVFQYVENIRVKNMRLHFSYEENGPLTDGDFKIL